MTTTPRHPLVEDYLAELRRCADRLPRDEREELLAELRAHVDAGAEQADTEADIRNMLDSLGSPEEIVAASAPSSPGTGSTGRLALGFGIAAVVLLPWLIFSVPLGIVAVILGLRARRFLRSAGQPTSIAIGAVTTGALAIAIPVLMFIFLVGVRTETGGDSSEPEVVQTFEPTTTTVD